LDTPFTWLPESSSRNDENDDDDDDEHVERGEKGRGKNYRARGDNADRSWLDHFLERNEKLSMMESQRAISRKREGA